MTETVMKCLLPLTLVLGCLPSLAAGTSIPFRPARSEVKVSVSTPLPLTAAELRVPVYRFRTDAIWRCPLPSLPAGKSSVSVAWSDFAADDGSGEPLPPTNVDVVEFVPDEAATNVIVSLADGGEPLSGGALTALPAFDAAPDAAGWRRGIPAEGFGRFGWKAEENGLLTFNPTFDSVFCMAGGQSIRYRFGSGEGLKPVWTRPYANSTTLFVERLLRPSGAAVQPGSKAFGVYDRSRSPEKLIAGILAPGLLLKSADRVLTLEPDATYGAVWLLVPVGGRAVWRTGETVALGDMDEGWAVLVSEKKPGLPLAVAFDRRPSRAVRSGRGFAFEFDEPRGWAGLSLPCGIRAWAGAPGTDGAATDALAAAARRDGVFLRNYPVRMEMRFRMTDRDVEFEERPSFVRWRNAWGEAGEPSAPCPPLVAFAADVGYPVRFPAGAPDDTGIATKYGPYRTWPRSKTSVARYALPRGAKDQTLYPRPVGDAAATAVAEAIVARFRSCKPVGHVADSLIGWFLWASAATAQPLFSPTLRAEFEDRWRAGARVLADERIWHMRREPLSGTAYPVSFAWTDGAEKVLGDANSGVGAALSGLDAWARLTGDWAGVATVWEKIRRMPLYFLYGHDWTMLQAGCREHTAASAIDMDVMTYEGTAALVRMADALGKPDAAATGEMLLARYALSLVAKFHGPGWKTPGVPHGEWLTCGTGLNELFGFETMGRASGGPNLVNSEIALSFAWAGEFPCVFRQLLDGNGPAFWRTHEYAFVETRLDDWRKAHPGHRNWHHANIAPHLYMRTLLGESHKTLACELAAQKLDRPQPQAAAECAGLYALLFGGEAPVRLESFAPAKLVAFDWNREKKTVTASFEAERPFCPRVTVRGRAKAAPDLSAGLPAGRSTVVWRF